MYIKNIKYLLVLFIFLSFLTTEASYTNGTIDTIYKSALLCTNDTCTTTSQINFKPTLGNPVSITDSAIIGNIWSETFGWVNLNPSYGGVTNTSSGTLGGYAWGDGAGWINFAPTQGGVTINTVGQFSGFAWSENFGWIKFDCSVSNACVQTDWRPLSVRGNQGTSTSGGFIVPSTPPITTPTDDTTTIPPFVEVKKEETQPTIIPAVEPVLPPDTKEPVSPPVIINNNTDNKSTPEPAQGFQKVSGSFNDVVYNFVNQSKEVFVDSLNKTKIIATELVKNVDNVIDTPAGDATSKVVATTGLISGAYISITTVLFANPLTFGELFLIPMRLWGLLLVAFGIKKRNLPWGTVYDSVTKQPIDPAYVVLQDLKGNEIATSITDLDGRYGFLVPAGSYRLVVNKTNYMFPSVKLKGQDIDTIYNNLYFDQIIEVKDGEIINNNIPLDPLKFDWNEFTKNDQKLMRFFSRREVWIARGSDVLFILGLILSIIAIIFSPKLYNIIIFVVYVALFILRKTILKSRSYGKVISKDTANPLSFAIITIFFTNTQNEFMHKVTDKTGKYYCLIPNGTYFTKIESKNPDESYSLVYTSEAIEVKKGYINKMFEV